MIWGRFTCTSQSILIETIIKVRIVITSKLDQMRQEIVPIKVVLIKRKIVDFFNFAVYCNELKIIVLNRINQFHDINIKQQTMS